MVQLTLPHIKKIRELESIEKAIDKEYLKADSVKRPIITGLTTFTQEILGVDEKTAIIISTHIFKDFMDYFVNKLEYLNKLKQLYTSDEKEQNIKKLINRGW